MRERRGVHLFERGAVLGVEGHAEAREGLEAGRRAAVARRARPRMLQRGRRLRLAPAQVCPQTPPGRHLPHQHPQRVHVRCLGCNHPDVLSAVVIFGSTLSDGCSGYASSTLQPRMVPTQDRMACRPSSRHPAVNSSRQQPRKSSFPVSFVVSLEPHWGIPTLISH